MNPLLDSHAFVWYAVGDGARLPHPVIEKIDRRQSAVWVSVATLWELTIKSSLGKLGLPAAPVDMLADLTRENAFGLLGIKPDHLRSLQQLPFIADHRDRFDRMIVAQASAEGLTLVSRDRKLHNYGVEVVWD